VAEDLASLSVALRAECARAAAVHARTVEVMLYAAAVHDRVHADRRAAAARRGRRTCRAASRARGEPAPDGERKPRDDP